MEKYSLVELFIFVLPAFLLSLSLVMIHVYFGIRIFERGVIFADISIAQCASLGYAIALMLHIEDKILQYTIGVLVSSLAGLLFSAVKNERFEVKEGVVGAVYAFAYSLTILVMTKVPGEAEHLRLMLTGNILFVRYDDVFKASLIYLGIGFLHLVLNKKFQISSASPVWEFIFYSTFSIVVSSSVSLAGVILVFSYLVIPSLLSYVLIHNRSFVEKLLLGWFVGLISTLLGFLISIYFDIPTSPTITAILWVVVFWVLMGKLIKGSRST